MYCPTWDVMVGSVCVPWLNDVYGGVMYDIYGVYMLYFPAQCMSCTSSSPGDAPF